MTDQQMPPESSSSEVSDSPSDAKGVAGASARREYERRRVKDEERIRQKWGRLGGIAVALSDERQTTTAWREGAIGEERLAARLDGAVSPHLAVLHDRRIPKSRANIDHIAVTPGLSPLGWCTNLCSLTLRWF